MNKKTLFIGRKGNEKHESKGQGLSGICRKDITKDKFVATNGKSLSHRWSNLLHWTIYCQYGNEPVWLGQGYSRKLVLHAVNTCQHNSYRL